MKTSHCILLLPILLGSILSGQESVRPRVFADVNELVSSWSARQHVWIAGNLPVSEQNLAALETWIAARAPNWTAVLMKNARGQSFEHYRGMDAVEHALGKGLSNQTNFGSQLHPKTGQSHGAIFILFLDERKFSYFASDAYDDRNLGESHWIGRLDREAIRAMRSGGRISDAVKNTITSIDRKLEQAIQREEEAARRAAVAEQRRIEEAKKLPETIEQQIVAMTTRAASFRGRNSDFVGPLAFPPEGEWRADQEAVRLHLRNEDFQTAWQLADVTLKKIEGYSDSLTQWAEDGRRIERLGNRLRQISVQTEAPGVEGLLSRCKSSIQSAKNNYRFGDPVYLDQIAAAGEALNRADSEIRAYQSRLRAAEQRARARLQRQKARKIRNGSVGGGLGVAFLACLVFLNRRRRKRKDEAHRLYAEWRTRLRGRFNRLFSLMDRTSVIQRNSGQFTAKTRSLTDSTVRTVDELFIMSSATDRVMERVECLIDPRGPWGKLVNLFSRSRYQKGIELMDSKVIGFDKSEGLRAILRSGKQKDTRTLLGSEKDYRPFSMSFKQLIGAYDSRELRATGQLERLEHCIDGLPLAMEKAGEAMEQIELRIANLNEASRRDHFFPLSRLQDELLTSIGRHLDEATGIGTGDPVSAMEGPATKATRQIADVSALIGLVESIRAVVFPFLEQAGNRLDSFRLPIEWIDRAVTDLSEQVEKVSSIAIEHSIADKLEALHDDQVRLRGRVKSVINLVERLEGETELLIQGQAERISRVRIELAELLHLQVDDILVEEGLDPSDRIRQSEEAVLRIREALGQGNLEAAQEGFRESAHRLEEVDDLLEVSKEVAETGVEKIAELTEELNELRNELPEASALLKEMVTAYPSEVLLFKERFGGNMSGQKSIEGSIDEAEFHIEEADQSLGATHRNYLGGALIAAGGQLEKAANEAGFASHQVALIRDHYSELKKSERDNRKGYGEVLLQYRATLMKIEDPRTTEATMERQRDLGQSLDTLAKQLAAPLKNPFRNSRDLREAGLAMAELEDAVKADWEWHARASDEVKGARRVLQSTEQLIEDARNDGITDSRKLTDAFNQYFKLDRALLEWHVFLSSAHHDWEKAYRGAVEIEASALKTKGAIEQEIQAATKAANELQRAAVSISDLRNWRNSYRVSVDRDAGNSLFDEARDALASGDYHVALSSAAASAQSAASALLRAKSAARRARAAEEAERRRRAAAAAAISRRRSSSSFSSRGSSISRRSSISRSSSIGRSGSRSGSGFSRSGW